MKIQNRCVVCALMVLGAFLVNWGGAPARADVDAQKIENPQEGYTPGQLGSSVAMDGDTMIVGAPSSRTAAGAGAGMAVVYVCDDAGSWTQQTKLMAPDGAEGDNFGSSVSILGDTAVVGAVKDDHSGQTDSGAAYVFTRTDGVWTQQAKLIADDSTSGTCLGYSISITTDTVAVGACNIDEDKGGAYVFVRNGQAWEQQAKLSVTSGNTSRYFGYSISASGDTVVVGDKLGGANGSSGNHSRIGAAFAFKRTGQTWAQEANLVSTLTEGGNGFGTSVSVDGDTAIVGAPGYFTGPNGYAIVFKRSGTVWTQQQQLSKVAYGFNFGCSVSVKNGRMVVGAHGATYPIFAGAVYVYAVEEGTWTQQSILTTGSTSFDHFGDKVAVCANYLAVGNSFHSELWTSTHDGGSWSQPALLRIEYAQDAKFGASVAASTDNVLIGTNNSRAFSYAPQGEDVGQPSKLAVQGTYAAGANVAVCGQTAIVGAPSNHEPYVYAGTAYVFTHDTSGWTQQAQLTASDAALSDYFGYSVAITTDTVVVGAYRCDLGTTIDCGAAYIFTRNGDTWTEQAKLVASDAAANDYFGYSVAISGDTVIVGAAMDDGAAINTGSAYVFVRDGVTWTQQAKLKAADAAADDNFGCCVSIDGDTVAIGAYKGDGIFNEELCLDSGLAYVFARTGSTWTQQAKLTDSSGAASDAFGSSICLTSNTLVVGVPGDDTTLTDVGSVCVFTRCGSDWTQRAKLFATDPADSDGLGSAVAIANGTVVAGAWLKDDPEPDSGAGYIYHWPVQTPTVHSEVTLTSDSTPLWSWTSTGGCGHFRYRLDDGEWTETDETSWSSEDSLTDGAHTLEVQELSGFGQWSGSVSFTVTVDATAPAAPSFEGGSASTINTTPTWSWSSGGQGCGLFRYQLDGTDEGGWIQTQDTSWTPSSALAQGTHTLYVQECDDAGNWSTSVSFTVTIRSETAVQGWAVYE